MSPSKERSSRQEISVCAMKMAFSIVAFSAIAAMSSTEGKGWLIFGFPPIIVQYQFYRVSYMCFDVADAILTGAPLTRHPCATLLTTQLYLISDSLKSIFNRFAFRCPGCRIGRTGRCRLFHFFFFPNRIILRNLTLAHSFPRALRGGDSLVV